MNAVEIESAISDLALEPFDAAEFPYAFLAAFGNKDTTLKRLRAGNNNASDVPGGVLLRSNIHIAACAPGTVGETLKTLRASPATTKAKAKFILATDGQTLEAEELSTGETIACDYEDFPNHFGFLLPLAGISTIKEIKENPIDVRATSRLNKLYVELLSENPDWARAERRADMNHFMARLVFCFFAEDTDIFQGDGLFTKTVEQYSERDGSNSHEVLSEIFRAMDLKLAERPSAEPRLPGWANKFPYVNGGLFAGSTETPRFTRMARTYLVHAGNLNWQKINPDIFGSMIQAVADDEERGALGMHYTSVPNILKVLNPLFLDDLRGQLEAAGDNKAKLLNLRKRIARIRVFDPACGSGNFLVIAYKQMREIEAAINQRRGEAHNKSEIPLTNFRGIELRDFPAEIARLALIIAEYQCDVLYRGQQDALEEFLPLDTQNWIICGNALRLDWLSICPPTGTGVKVLADDLFGTPLDQSEIEFENEGGETYICGNPPYKGSKYQSTEQKNDLKEVFKNTKAGWKSLDYVSGWLIKAKEYGRHVKSAFAFVTTNSICQGIQVPELWPHLIRDNFEINFAYTSFKWSNLASNKAGVTVVIVGMSNYSKSDRKIFSLDDKGLATAARTVPNINAYLISGHNIFIQKKSRRTDNVSNMDFGNKAVDGGHLYLERETLKDLPEEVSSKFVRKIYGATELIKGIPRFCLWIPDSEVEYAQENSLIASRLNLVREMRLTSEKLPTRRGAEQPHKFEERRQRGGEKIIALPRITSENREYLPVGLLDSGTIVSSQLFAFYNEDVFLFALLVSRLHWVWMATVCARMRTDFSYSNTLGWNTFPIPLLTEQNKADLTACAEAILLAREVHFPATIADLYDAETMPDNLRHAHERNDEVLERIYIGRRFKNDTERLEKLFELYTNMTAGQAKAAPRTKKEKSA
ncbi:Type II restriction/modification system, DNA methylase subunit YeeA [Pseudomonas pohangensis]|uniref:site-specific DNA-methyltransferase (adenine-specific) n=1 Tax=Pseudomonas pohangensis TaxID=364197 RepID=A0A1H2ESB9_9PSED|nr:DNA methyltransferase [Pseudomonas pohangensis]SDT98010.1 Type II restriction/modification system, DNA methylase subunit YeeA [Pseudomonas pohangensis]